MLQIKCTSKLCSLRSKCRIVHKAGTMMPTVSRISVGNIPLTCHSERLTETDEKPSENSSKPNNSLNKFPKPMAVKVKGIL